MTEIILSLTAATLCILGLTEVLHTLKQKMLFPKKYPKTRLIVYLDGENADLQLASIAEQYRWSGKGLAGEIVAVYSAISSESLENCRKLAEKHNIIICSEKDLKNCAERTKNNEQYGLRGLFRSVRCYLMVR